MIPAVRCGASKGPCPGPGLSFEERALGPGQPVSSPRLSLQWPFPFSLIPLIFVLFFLITNLTYSHGNANSSNIADVLSETQLC